MAKSCSYSSMVYVCHRYVSKEGTGSVYFMGFTNRQLNPTFPCITTTHKKQGSVTSSVASS